jgi:hypothetical protein
MQIPFSKKWRRCFALRDLDGKIEMVVTTVQVIMVRVAETIQKVIPRGSSI